VRFLVWFEARVVASDASCVAGADIRIASLLLSSLTQCRVVERPLNRPRTKRGNIIVTLGANPPGSGLRWEHQVPSKKRERGGGMSKFHALTLC
jgi:hypothetical protein